MPGHQSAARKHHGPGNVTWPAEKFAIHEITDSPQPQANGNGYNVNVGALKKIQPFFPAKNPASGYHAKKSAVKRHSPLPGGHDFQRMLEIIAEIIKENIAQTTAENQGDNKNKIEVFKMIRQFPAAKFFNLKADQKKGRHKAQYVHQTVPADLERTHSEKDRINIGKGKQAITLVYVKRDGETLMKSLS